ncbi:MAG: ATP-binding cassette domain-containing protein, partial [Planctomycetes bacterium]|nr:ATP-binding cassette domain-containing protein [Planctomycetota bacterium]
MPPIATLPATSNNLAVSTAAKPNISARGLNYYFGEGDLRKQVLYENNLDVMPGEIVIMTGPSGSGKTTLLTLIGGLRAAKEGSLNVLGREMVGASPADLVKLRRQIGFIFQAHNLFESLTAHQNVKMALELFAFSQQEMKQRITEMLTRLG